MLILAISIIIIGAIAASLFRAHKSRSVRLLTCVIRPEGLQNVVAALRREDLMLGMTVMNARGFGRQKGDAKTEEETIRLLPKLKLEILVMQKDEDRVMDAIGNALRTGEIGDGKIIIFPVVTVMRVRTGERSASALF